jgi:CelD/BcsL family acetyltransferase involved in cellulose biosynthesis
LSKERLTILSVAYPLAPVGPDAVGGAEQILTRLDEALERAGHTSVVVAQEGSSTRGILLPVPRIGGPLDDAAIAAVQAASRRAIEHALRTFAVDLIHVHGLDFDRYVPPPGAPLLATLHLPIHLYAPTVFDCPRPGTFLQCVSRTQHAALPAATRTPVVDPIPNGVPIEHLPLCSRKREYVAAVGRICPEKGFHLAADAARRAGVALVLAGQVFGYPAHQEYFRDVLAPRLDPRWFRYAGPLGLVQKRTLLGQARCLLVPSQTPETSSLVAMEALACGTPVVAFRAGALGEIVEHGRTGFLVDSVDEMADAISHQVDSIDPAECRRRATERFSADTMTARYVARYARLVAARRAAPVRGRLAMEEVTTAGDLARVRGKWADLWRRVPGSSVFQHPDWLIPWCRPFHVHEPWLLLFRRGGRLVGAAPFLVYPRGDQRVLTLMGAGISDDQDILVDPREREAVLDGLWAYLADRGQRWDVCELENLRVDSLLLGSPPRAWRAGQVLQDAVRPVLSLGPHVRRLEEAVPRRLVKEIRYVQRRAERDGLPVSVETVTDASFERSFGALVDLHRARWRQRGEQGMLAGGLEEFHREAARRLLQDGLLRMYTLSLGRHLAAAFYGYHAAGRTVFYLGGFEPAFAGYSPGKLVVAHAIEAAMARDRAQAFDFLRGAEAYKYAWGAVDEPLFRRTLWLVQARHSPDREAAHAA